MVFRRQELYLTIVSIAWLVQVLSLASFTEAFVEDNHDAFILLVAQAAINQMTLASSASSMDSCPSIVYQIAYAISWNNC